MALKGDLASVDLAQVFQMLALNQKVGLLSIQGASWNALYFDHRGVTLYYNEHLILDKVLGQLVRAGTLHSDSVREVREHAARSGHTVVESLLAGCFLSEQDLEAAFRSEMEEEIYDIFFWRDARFEFFEGATGFEGREGIVNERFFFSTDSLIMEAARRIDEWAFIRERVPGPDEIYEAADDGSNVMKLDDTALSVLELVDGKRNVQRLIEVTGLSPFHAYKSLAQLLEQGMIAATPTQHLIDAAQECVAEGRLKDAINLYERAISLGEGVPDSHAMAAETYEATQEYELASYHLKCVAEFRASTGDIEQAVRLLLHVIEMMPTDLAARERLVELTLGAQGFKSPGIDPVSEGKILVDLYIEIGEIDRVRGILEKLLRDNPEDVDLKKSLINVHTKAGDTKRVIELYESIAQDLVAKSQPIEAVKYLQKVLMIDRSRKDVSERIRSLYELDERRRSRRRTMAALGAMLAIIAALGVVWYFYEQHARRHFDQLDVSALLDQKEFAAASTVFKSFVQSYPLTLVARDAEAQMARIDSLWLAHEAQLKQQRIRVEAARNRQREVYRKEWDRYLSEFQAQNLAAALEHLENVRRMVAEVDADVDRDWAREVQLDKSVNELRTYIGEAAALERSARELLAEDRWREAREKLLALTKRYEITEVAKRARIPMLLTSMPPGAEIWEGGRRLRFGTETEDGLQRTPAVVYCQPNREQTFELRSPGFRPLRIAVDPRQSATSHHVLTVIPDTEFDFGSPVQTGAGAAGGFLVAGLRGGEIGLTRDQNGGQASSIKLGGLREVQGTPVVVLDRAFVRTNDGKLACYRLPDGTERFTRSLDSEPVHDPVARDGRLLYVDVSGQLNCLDMGRGGTLWSVSVPGGEVAGPPAIESRQVRVGTQSGVYMIVDVTDGAVIRTFTSLPGLSSAVIAVKGVGFFATQDGHVAALDESSGRLFWRTQVGSGPSQGQLCLIGESLFVCNGTGRITKLNARDGSVEASFDLPGRAQSGPVCAGRRLFVAVREQIDENEQRDLLLALDQESLEVAWEFRDGGQFLGPVTTDGNAAYLPGSGGKVLRFR